MEETPFRPDTRLTLYPLVIRREHQAFIIGRVETGVFISVPEVGQHIVESFQQGHSLAETQAALAGQGVDAVELSTFAADLLDLGFLSAVNDVPLNHPQAQPAPLSWLKPRQVRWLFSWPSAVVLAGLLIAAVITALRQPGILPAPADFIWSPLLSMVVAINLVFWVSHRALHEVAHIAAARGQGMPVQVRAGQRHRSLILQADVTGAWALPRAKRYRIYAAGLVWDIALASILILILAYVSLPTTVRAVLASWLFIALLALLSEFRLSSRTDVSQICFDLFPTEAAPAQARRPSPRAAEPAPARPPRFRHAVLPWILGAATIFVIAAIVTGVFPVVIGLVSLAVAHVEVGWQSGNPSLLLDGAFTLVATAVVLALALDSVLQQRLTTFTSPSAQIRRRFPVARRSADSGAAFDAAQSPTRASS